MPHILDTDASETEMGGCRRIAYFVAYFSRSLSQPEQNYCLTRRELLGVIRSWTTSTITSVVPLPGLSSILTTRHCVY